MSNPKKIVAPSAAKQKAHNVAATRIQPGTTPPRGPAVRSARSRRSAHASLYWALGSLVVVGLLVASFFAGSQGTSGGALTHSALSVGAKAPKFAGTDPVTGRMIDATSLHGKNVLYYFSSGSTCQACMTQAQALQRDSAQLERAHITLVMVTNDTSTALASAAKSYGLSIPMVADPGGAITNRFGAVGGGMDMGANNADHRFLLVDSDGVVRFNEDFPTMWISTAALIHRFPRMM